MYFLRDIKGYPMKGIPPGGIFTRFENNVGSYSCFRCRMLRKFEFCGEEGAAKI